MCFESFPAEPLEGGRGLLEASGNGWRPLEPPGGSCSLLEAPTRVYYKRRAIPAQRSQAKKK